MPPAAVSATAEVVAVFRWRNGAVVRVTRSSSAAPAAAQEATGAAFSPQVRDEASGEGGIAEDIRSVAADDCGRDTSDSPTVNGTHRAVAVELPASVALTRRLMPKAGPPTYRTHRRIYWLDGRRWRPEPWQRVWSRAERRRRLHGCGIVNCPSRRAYVVGDSGVPMPPVMACPSPQRRHRQRHPRRRFRQGRYRTPSVVSTTAAALAVGCGGEPSWGGPLSENFPRSAPSGERAVLNQRLTGCAPLSWRSYESPTPRERPRRAPPPLTARYTPFCG